MSKKLRSDVEEFVMPSYSPSTPASVIAAPVIAAPITTPNPTPVKKTALRATAAAWVPDFPVNFSPVSVSSPVIPAVNVTKPTNLNLSTPEFVPTSLPSTQSTSSSTSASVSATSSSSSAPQTVTSAPETQAGPGTPTLRPKLNGVFSKNELVIKAAEKEKAEKDRIQKEMSEKEKAAAPTNATTQTNTATPVSSSSRQAELESDDESEEEATQRSRENVALPVGVPMNYTYSQLMYFRDDITPSFADLADFKDILRPKDQKNNIKDWREGVIRKQFQRNVRVEPEVKALEKTDSGYKVKLDAEGDEKKLREMNSILNKLTPEKFDSLVEKAMSIEIDSIVLLERCVEAVMEKALNEPAFSPTYAQFCFRLSTISSTESTEEKTNNATFKKLVLTLCQKEFAKQLDDEKDKRATDPKEFAKLTEEQQMEVMKTKKRMLGAIRFIGELFVLNMLKPNIITDECVSKLIESPFEEDMEALCKLLTTVGAKLDQLGEQVSVTRADGKKTADGSKIAAKMTKIYTSLAQKSEPSSKLPSRIRFMIKDLLELRQAFWRKKGTELVAKKLSEFKSDVAAQQAAAQAKPVPQSQTPNSANKPKASSRYEVKSGAQGNVAVTGSNKKPLGNSRPGSAAANVEDDGWETTGSKKNSGRGGFNKSGSQDIRRGNGGGQDSRRGESMQGRPGRVENKVAAAAAGNASDGQSVRPTVKKHNMYGFLNDEDDKDDHGSREEEVKEHVVEEEVSSPTSAKNKSSISEDDAKALMKTILVEFFTGGDFKEVAKRLADLGNDNLSHHLIESAWHYVSSKDFKVHPKVVELLTYLTENKVLSKEQIHLGYKKALGCVVDWMDECPKMLQVMVPSLCKMVDAGCLSIDNFFVGEIYASLEFVSPTDLKQFYISLTKGFQSVTGLSKSDLDAKYNSCGAADALATYLNMKPEEVQATILNAQP